MSEETESTEGQDDKWEEYVATDIGQFAQIPLWFLELTPRPSSRAVHCLTVLLAKWADRHTSRCYPSRQTIGEMMNASVDTVDRALAELVKLGVLSKSGGVRPDGSRGTNTYSISLARPHQCGGHAAPVPSGHAANLRRGSRTSARAEPESVNQNQKEPKKRTLASPLTPEEEQAFAVEFSDVPHVLDEIAAIKGKPPYYVSKNKPAEMRRYLNFARDRAIQFAPSRPSVTTRAPHVYTAADFGLTDEEYAASFVSDKGYEN